jgi:hypothetical protein
MFRAFVPFVLVVLFALPGITGAATLYFDPPTTTLYRGDAVSVAVRLDTDEQQFECVNAVDGVISYSSNITPVDISLGESILPIWVESPIINKESRTITFAGGIPNGYCGRVPGDPQLTNKLFEIVFRAPGLQVGVASSADEAIVNFTDQTTVYLNDGFGTALQPAVLPATFTLRDSFGSELKDPWRDAVLADDTPPEPFSILLERSETAFDGKYYITFNTSDKQTGMSIYEVMEENTQKDSFFNFGAATAPWREIRSPYVLQDQSLSSTIFVRAIDKAGNEYVATLAPQNKTSQFYGINPLYVAIAGGLCVLALLLLGGYTLCRRRRRKSALITTEELSSTQD